MTALPAVELPRGFEDLRGRRFAERYLVAEVLAVGRSHVVYGATDREGGEVLLRILRPALLHDRAAVERFVQRSQGARRASHARARPALDAGPCADGLLYLVCARPPGYALSRYVAEHEQGRLPWPLARGVLQGMIDVLKAAHIRRIVHGAMTPDSIWIEERHGSPLLPHLVDLGASHGLGLEDDVESVGTAALVADMEFMAPETIAHGRCDQRTDIYHLGLLTHFMLVGRPPFHGDNQFLVSVRQVREPVPALRAIVTELPEAVEALVAGMLAKDPAARLQTLTKVERALGSIRGEVAVVTVKAKAREGRLPEAKSQAPKPEEVPAPEIAEVRPHARFDEPFPRAGTPEQHIATEPERTNLLRYDELLVPTAAGDAVETTAVLAVGPEPFVAALEVPEPTLVLAAAPTVSCPAPTHWKPETHMLREERLPLLSPTAVDEGTIAIGRGEIIWPASPSTVPHPQPAEDSEPAPMLWTDGPSDPEPAEPPRGSPVPVVWLALAFGSTVVAGVVVGIWLAQ